MKLTWHSPAARLEGRLLRPDQPSATPAHVLHLFLNLLLMLTLYHCLNCLHQFFSFSLILRIPLLSQNPLPSILNPQALTLSLLPHLTLESLPELSTSHAERGKRVRTRSKKYSPEVNRLTIGKALSTFGTPAEETIDKELTQMEEKGVYTLPPESVKASKVAPIPSMTVSN
jgi:hypothetical protein